MNKYGKSKHKGFIIQGCEINGNRLTIYEGSDILARDVIPEIVK